MMVMRKSTGTVIPPVATQLRRTAFPGEDQAAMKQPDDVAGLFLEQVLA